MSCLKQLKIILSAVKAIICKYQLLVLKKYNGLKIASAIIGTHMITICDKCRIQFELAYLC